MMVGSANFLVASSSLSELPHTFIALFGQRRKRSRSKRQLRETCSRRLARPALVRGAAGRFAVKKLALLLRASIAIPTSPEESQCLGEQVLKAVSNVAEAATNLSETVQVKDSMNFSYA